MNVPENKKRRKAVFVDLIKKRRREQRRIAAKNRAETKEIKRVQEWIDALIKKGGGFHPPAMPPDGTAD